MIDHCLLNDFGHVLAHKGHIRHGFELKWLVAYHCAQGLQADAIQLE
jgi:hypothetical protein